MQEGYFIPQHCAGLVHCMVKIVVIMEKFSMSGAIFYEFECHRLLTVNETTDEYAMPLRLENRKRDTRSSQL